MNKLVLALLLMAGHVRAQAVETNALAVMRLRHEALTIHLDAIVAAESKWMGKYQLRVRNGTDEEVGGWLKLPDRYQGIAPDTTPIAIFKAIHNALAARKVAIITELMLLENQTARLTNAAPDIIENVSVLTAETASAVNSTVQGTLTEQVPANTNPEPISGSQ